MNHYENFNKIERCLREEFAYNVWDIVSARDLKEVERDYRFAVAILYALRHRGRQIDGTLDTPIQGIVKKYLKAAKSPKKSESSGISWDTKLAPVSEDLGDSKDSKDSKDLKDSRSSKTTNYRKSLEIYDEFRGRVGLPKVPAKTKIFRLEDIPGSDFNRDFLERMLGCLFNFTRGGSITDFYQLNREYLSEDLWEPRLYTALSSFPEVMIWEALCVPPSISTPLLLMDFPKSKIPKLARPGKTKDPGFHGT